MATDGNRWELAVTPMANAVDDSDTSPNPSDTLKRKMRLERLTRFQTPR